MILYVRFSAGRSAQSAIRWSASSNNKWWGNNLSRSENKTHVAAFSSSTTVRVIEEKMELAVEDAVGRYLRKRHPDIFRATTMKGLGMTPTKEKNPPKTQNISSIGRLALLNGFQMVDTPKPEERVPLAEGIVAKPGYYSTLRRGDIKYTLYSQPLDEHKAPTIEKLPDLVEEDINIYRILENRVQEMLNYWNDSFKSRIQPLKKIVKRMKGGSATQATGSELATQDEENLEDNLLVVTDHSMVLVTHIRPSLRLLALPFDLGHNGASTLISVFLVVFGAMPVAYRSFNFAVTYPGLSQVIKTSVVVTIMYGIWSTRSISRTRQSQVVANALSRRVYARDDAVILVLQDGAIRRVSESVFEVYQQIAVGNKEAGEIAFDRQHLVNPTDIALELGLIEKTIVGSNHEWAALPLEKALSGLESRSASL